MMSVDSLQRERSLHIPARQYLPDVLDKGLDWACQAHGASTLSLAKAIPMGL
jgi:hypothetical protein